MMKLTETYTSLTQTHIKFDIYQPNVILRYKGIIQLHHGLCEHSDRYQKFAEYLRDIHHQPEQVQDFYPTPGTLSTTMYYTGLDPRDMTPVYVPKDPKEKAMQRALIQYKNPKNYDLVYEALIKANRKDLIGFGKKCLIKPRTKRQNYNRSYTRGHK